ncbi:dTDP-4-dehydrorhamnose reductase [Ferruginibacter sp. HRS2-29]|uniref:dTDP-4-dehydrorhamnose reductase n=1 Tax=Ferruginibacter sp. HRS2-29 TaxID=2487334 RepID=UPI0020CF67C5|nr:dTDP-4-dehydrorhamnose reductase [Ferruginibacter sp. HRS2-29]MCP9753204.1 dTDP-4-dehydrorhamnose reductase [Ferruginibacter sp. HRS2-29]
MNSNKNILVTGANGQLGTEFRQLEKTYSEFNFLFVSRDELSIGDAAAVAEYFSVNKIDVCINCAAYTAVDKAETEKLTAFEINATAAGNLAEVCSRYGTRFIHISTDYVFPGNGEQPYKETDDTHPINVYAASKLEGEKLVIAANPGAIIIRTSWVYSSFGKNFVKTMLRLMAEKETIGVVSDQMGCPTYAADLADAIMCIIAENNFVAGIYHYCNQGVISWFEFATAIKTISGSKCLVNPIATQDYPTPAMRPHYSALDTAKFSGTFNIVIPAWEDSLRKCIGML